MKLNELRLNIELKLKLNISTLKSSKVDITHMISATKTKSIDNISIGVTKLQILTQKDISYKEK